VFVGEDKAKAFGDLFFGFSVLEFFSFFVRWVRGWVS
jgi:hypothetical protein